MKKYIRLSKQNLSTTENLPNWIKTRTDLVHTVSTHTDLENVWPLIPNALIRPRSYDEWDRFLFVKNSWQLTVLGAVLMQHIYQFYKVNHVNNAFASGRALINMNASLNSPWYWQGQDIFVWNQDSFFELSLFDGDVKRFIDFKQPKS